MSATRVASGATSRSSSTTAAGRSSPRGTRRTCPTSRGRSTRCSPRSPPSAREGSRTAGRDRFGRTKQPISSCCRDFVLLTCFRAPRCAPGAGAVSASRPTFERGARQHHRTRHGTAACAESLNLHCNLRVMAMTLRLSADEDATLTRLAQSFKTSKNSAAAVAIDLAAPKPTTRSSWRPRPAASSIDTLVSWRASPRRDSGRPLGRDRHIRPSRRTTSLGVRCPRSSRRRRSRRRST